MKIYNILLTVDDKPMNLEIKLCSRFTLYHETRNYQCMQNLQTMTTN